MPTLELVGIDIEEIMGISTPKLIIRPFTVCAAPASWRVLCKATRSTRSPTTSACHGTERLSTTCASAIR